MHMRLHAWLLDLGIGFIITSYYFTHLPILLVSTTLLCSPLLVTAQTSVSEFFLSLLSIFLPCRLVLFVCNIATFVCSCLDTGHVFCFGSGLLYPSFYRHHTWHSCACAMCMLNFCLLSCRLHFTHKLAQQFSRILFTVIATCRSPSSL